MVDQTILEQHLKQLRKHAEHTEAVSNHFENQMLPPYEFNNNQDRYTT
jgi:hypothetical protein